ncbi:MAG: hypothetical protein CV082_04620 [Candidatus Brocadia sp. BL1]|nr:MAG: hypothetical protein CV082_04620 [Candidatus Brocadia sp. BL1]
MSVCKHQHTEVFLLWQRYELAGRKVFYPVLLSIVKFGKIFLCRFSDIQQSSHSYNLAYFELPYKLSLWV